MTLPAHVRTRLLILLAAVLWAAVLLPAVADSEGTPTIEANNACPGRCWKPPSATVNAGGAVNIANPTTVPHGVEWRSGPATPSCTSGVPVGTNPGASGTNWSGSCTFAMPGKYTFFCTVHGAEMTGTITVNGLGVPTVKKLSPKKGSAAGGTSVTIAGTNFTAATAVKFGPIAATSFTVTSDTSISAVSPAESAGRVDVTVTGPGGTSAISKGDRFKFVKKHK
jgi:plastocyanin